MTRPPAVRLPNACVIGAGSSGIAVVKALGDAGIECDRFQTIHAPCGSG